MSIRQYLNTEGNNIGKLTGNMLAIDVAGNLTKSITTNGSILLTALGGGGGNVDSVNSLTGVVLLDCDNIPQTTRLYSDATEKAQITTNENDITNIQNDLSTIQTDVNNINIDLSNTNGTDELTRTDGTGKLPYDIIYPNELYQWDFPTLGIIANDNVDTLLSGGSEIFSRGTGNFSPIGEFIVGVTGVYIVTVNITFAADILFPAFDLIGYRQLKFFINNVDAGLGYTGTSSNAITSNLVVCDTVILPLNAGETLSIYTYQNSGTSLAISGGNYRISKFQLQ